MNWHVTISKQFCCHFQLISYLNSMHSLQFAIIKWLEFPQTFNFLSILARARDTRLSNNHETRKTTRRIYSFQLTQIIFNGFCGHFAQNSKNHFIKYAFPQHWTGNFSLSWLSKHKFIKFHRIIYNFDCFMRCLHQFRVTRESTNSNSLVTMQYVIRTIVRHAVIFHSMGERISQLTDLIILCIWFTHWKQWWCESQHRTIPLTCVCAGGYMLDI